MGNGMNFFELLQLMKQYKNPQQLLYGLLKEKSNGNPFFANLLALGEQGKEEEILKIARNTMKEQGKDFDKEFTNFRKMLKL